jgi:hypothetical protein
MMPWTSYIVTDDEYANALLQSNVMGVKIKNAPLGEGDAPVRVEPSDVSDIIEEMRKGK